MTIERSMLSSSATSCAVVRKSAKRWPSVGHCHLLTAGRAPHRQGSRLLLEPRTACLLAVPGPNVLLMLQVVATALQLV